MKKFSEFKFKKVDLNKIQKDFTELMMAFTNAKSFEEQDKILVKYFKYIEFDFFGFICF